MIDISFFVLESITPIFGFGSLMIPIGLSIWGIGVGVTKAKMFFSASSGDDSSSDGGDDWKDMLSDSDGLYKDDDGNIRDESTGEIVFESRN